MQLFKTIRDILGIRQSPMSDLLKISKQRYAYLEAESEKVTLETLVRVKELSKLDIEKFWKLIEKEAGEK